tara:strand:- start:737 stop:1108 length:372 start_codon:yes stop_codon:yes gene_type:complete
MSMPKPKRVNTAVWILYVISFLGILELFTSASIKGENPPLMLLDIIVFIAMIGIAFGISKRIAAAKILYLVLAIVWYVVAIFYLPLAYGHDLNVGLIFIQIIMTIAAFYMLYQQKSRNWFNQK